MHPVLLSVHYFTVTSNEFNIVQLKDRVENDSVWKENELSFTHTWRFCLFSFMALSLPKNELKLKLKWYTINKNTPQCIMF